MTRLISNITLLSLVTALSTTRAHSVKEALLALKKTREERGLSASCTPCFGGVALPERSKIFEVGGKTMACEDLEVSASMAVFSQDPEASCLEVQSYAYMNCGCPQRPELADANQEKTGCTVCVDGSSVVDTNKEIVAGSGTTCGLMEMMGPTGVEKGVLTCADLQAEAFLDGCCIAMPQPVSPGCKICENRNVLESVSIMDDGVERSCGKLTEVMLSIPEDSKACSEIQEDMRDGECCDSESHLRGRM